MTFITNIYGQVTGLWRKVDMERYPTRTVEYMLAWMILVWSFGLLLPGPILVGPTYAYLLAIGPEQVWGLFGVVTGLATIYALIRNGGWKKSPILRFIGAALGAIWWLLLWVLYSAAIDAGAADFPMRRVYPVMIFFSLYSCFRCGQDYAATLQSPRASAGAVDNGG